MGLWLDVWEPVPIRCLLLASTSLRPKQLVGTKQASGKELEKSFRERNRELPVTRHGALGQRGRCARRCPGQTLGAWR